MLGPPALPSSRLERAVGRGVIAYLVLLVALPLVALGVFSAQGGARAFWTDLSTPVARSALWLSVWTALVVGILNVPFGIATAWLLTRFRFPGRAALSAMVDLPLAIPTLVTGLMLATLYGPELPAGRIAHRLGLEIVYAPAGIVLALLFVTVPFVPRAVEPVLAQLDPAEEEAAIVMGAGKWMTFKTVFLPAILPAALSGAIRSFGRALGEFGALVVVAGNVPRHTLSAPVFIYGEVESGAPHSAAASAVVVLAMALALHALAEALDRRASHRHV